MSSAVETETPEMTDDAARMCERYKPLVYLLARKSHHGSLRRETIEDLAQEGFLEIVKVVNDGKYDRDRASFHTFIHKCLRQKYGHLAVGQGARCRHVWPKQLEPAIALPSKPETPEAPEFPAELQVALWKRLSPKARIVFDCMMHRYPKACNYTKLGEYFSLSPSRIAQIGEEVRAKLRIILSKSAA